MPGKPLYLIGMGSDDHKIVPAIAGGKPLILAGITVSKDYSPVAHSDGDVVFHAISNALFLAIGGRDIGYHFPDTDPSYEGIKGEKLLLYAIGSVKEHGYKVCNLTVMLTAGRPRLSEYVERMKRNTARVLDVMVESVGIGATTGEQLSEHGKGNGINAVAQVLLEKANPHA